MYAFISMDISCPLLLLLWCDASIKFVVKIPTSEKCSFQLHTTIALEFDTPYHIVVQALVHVLCSLLTIPNLLMVVYSENKFSVI